MAKSGAKEGGKARKERMRRCLMPLIDNAGALCVFLVSRSGLPMAGCGDTAVADEGSLASVVAGAFAATKEVAGLLGEEGFSMMVQQGENRHVYLSLVSRDAVLVVIFDRSDRVGLVRYYAKSVMKKLQGLLPGGRERSEQPDEGIKDYATDLIDKLFG